MLDRLISLFEPDRAPTSGGLPALILSDYLAYYRERRESPRRLALLFLPRLAHNPCLHATVLIRLAMRSPKYTLGLWRTLLIAKHSIDIERRMEIGPGLVLPHPVGILLGWGLRIGKNVTILHVVSIGGKPRFPNRPMASPETTAGDTLETLRLCPTIEDGVTIYTQSIIVGPVTVGEGAVIGARSWVDKDVPAGAVVSSRD